MGSGKRWGRAGGTVAAGTVGTAAAAVAVGPAAAAAATVAVAGWIRIAMGALSRGHSLNKAW